MEITILTPTYNRGEYLLKLYNSLIEQTNKNFKWYIIDDGSCDNTEEIIKKFNTEKKINIVYEKKENGGKHTALNYVIKNIDTELIFIVDSDDWLKKNAVEQIYKIHKKYENDKRICGYSFLRMYPDGNINGKKFKFDEFIDNYIDVRINNKDTNSDKAEVWKTKILKENPFPEFEGEKFLGEDIIWIKLAAKYQMVFINEEIYISEYLSDGLTKNRRKNNIKSARGCFCRAETMLNVFKNKKVDYIFFIKVILQYQIYGLFSNMKVKNMYEKCINKISFIFLYPISYLLYLKWKRENKIDDKK